MTVADLDLGITGNVGTDINTVLLPPSPLIQKLVLQLLVIIPTHRAARRTYNTVAVGRGCALQPHSEQRLERTDQPTL